MSRRKPSQDDYGSSGRRSEDPYGGVDAELTYSPSSRRRPSEDNTMRGPGHNHSGSQSQMQDLARRPSTSASDSTSNTNAQSATAKSGMIIPNKSTIAEEEIEVPYGRETRESGSTEPRNRSHSPDADEVDEERDGDEMGVGLSALSRRLVASGTDDEPSMGAGGDEYFEKMSFGRASVNSDRSLRDRGGGRSSALQGGEESERIRRDYEFKIATMQTRIAGLEREVEDAGERERLKEGDERVLALEDELEELRRVRSCHTILCLSVTDCRLSEDGRAKCYDAFDAKGARGSTRGSSEEQGERGPQSKGGR